MGKRAKEACLPELPSGITLDILSRLPVKTIGKFRCVSKLWLSYLTDPYFFQLHRSQSRKKLLSLSCLIKPPNNHLGEVDATINIFTGDDKIRFINFFTKKIKLDQVEEDYNKIRLLTSNGLLCLAFVNHIYICNPSTQELFKLPDPSPSSISIGFGYLSSTQEYKVVRLFDEKKGKRRCEIFTISTSSSSSWRVVEQVCPHSTTETPIFANGSLHWKVNSRDANDARILSFDLEAEKFWVVPPPCCVSEISHPIFTLVEFRDNHLWLGMHSAAERMLEFWVLKDWENYVWVNEYSIDLSHDMDGYVSLELPIKFMNPEVMLIAVTTWSSRGIIYRPNYGRSLIYYNIRNRVLTKGSEPIYEICYYTEDLFSLGKALRSTASLHCE